MRSRSLLWSFNHAIEGVVYAVRTQRNMRIHVGAAIVAILVSLLLGVDRQGFLAIVFAIGIVFIAELVNTAVEAAVDLATDQFEPQAKIAKDVAAGAVLVASTIAVVIAYLALYDPLMRVGRQGLEWVRLGRQDITFAAFGITLLVVLIAKAVAREKNYFRGGWPSGHSALAFGLATAIGYISGSAAVLGLGFLIALLVAQSRVEGGIHSIPQVVLGAILGILTVTAVFQVFW